MIKIVTCHLLLNSGPKMKTHVERVIATLLTLICVVKVQFKDIQLPWILENPEREISYYSTNEGICFEVDKNKKVELSFYYAPVISWLQKQERELPPLYSSLELGRNKRDFVSNLAKIFY